VDVDISTARVQRVSEALSGEDVRALLEDRGEPQWCIAAKLAVARVQMADAECRPSELAVRLSPLQRATAQPERERAMTAGRRR
jgi:hypothetical protein